MTDVHVDRRPGSSIIDAKPLSTLEALRHEIQGRTPVRTITLEVPQRPGFTVTFGLKLEQLRLARWREESRDELVPGGFNAPLFNRTIVGYTAVQIFHDGEPLMDDGQPVSFRSDSFQRMLQVADPMEAVERFYDNDFNIDTTASRILIGAGFNVEVKEVDPTRK